MVGTKPDFYKSQGEKLEMVNQDGLEFYIKKAENRWLETGGEVTDLIILTHSSFTPTGCEIC